MVALYPGAARWVICAHNAHRDGVHRDALQRRQAKRTARPERATEARPSRQRSKIPTHTHPIQRATMPTPSIARQPWDGTGKPIVQSLRKIPRHGEVRPPLPKHIANAQDGAPDVKLAPTSRGTSGALPGKCDTRPPRRPGHENTRVDRDTCAKRDGSRRALRGMPASEATSRPKAEHTHRKGGQPTPRIAIKPPPGKSSTTATHKAKRDKSRQSCKAQVTTKLRLQCDGQPLPRPGQTRTAQNAAHTNP